MSNEVILNIIKDKDYIIRPFLFKIIKENELNINDALLLIYLSNQTNPTLDLNTIENTTSLNKEEILTSFATLTEKGLINTQIETTNGVSYEKISLDNVYKLAVSKINKTNKKAIEKNIFELFENEFARTLSPMELELINAWITSGITEEIIEEALKEATYNGVKTMRYIDKILYEWNKLGYKTKDDVIKNKMKKKETKENDNTFFFEYNWLDEN